MEFSQVTIETKTEIAIKMVLLDAIEKGHTKTNELVRYMESKTFKKAVKAYLELM